MARQSVLTLLAAALQALLWWAAIAVDDRFAPIAGPAPLWFELMQAPFNSIAGVLPGVALGYFAKRNGLLLGAACGLLAGPAQLLLVNSYWGLGLWSTTPQTFALLASSALGAAIASGVAGAAGELLARRAGSNNSFKPKPLRGSA